VLNFTGWLLVQTRQWDAAETALRMSMDAAGDPLAAVNTLDWLCLRQGRLAEARELCGRWADDIEPRISRATTAELAIWGRLHLGMANVCVLTSRPDPRRCERGQVQDLLSLIRAVVPADSPPHGGTEASRAGECGT
jgi:hypothetical protein